MRALAVQWLPHGLLALVAEGFDELVVGLVELLNALFFKPLGNLPEVDAQVRQARHDFLGELRVLADAHGRPAVVAIGINGLQRQRVDRLRSDQRLDILHIRIGRILGAGAGPQQPLGFRAVLLELEEGFAAVQFAGDAVGLTGAGNRHLTDQPLRQVGFVPGGAGELLQLRVYEHVNAAQEEAGHRVDIVDRLALRQPVLQARDVGLRDLDIAWQAKEQRHINIEPLGDELADRLQPRHGRRHLDEQIGPVHQRPQPPRLRDRLLGLVSQVRVHFQTDEPVGVLELLPGRAQHVRRRLDVLHREGRVHLLDALALQRPGFHRRVVIAAAGDRLFED